MIPEAAQRAAEAAFTEKLVELRLAEGRGFKAASQQRRAIAFALEAAAPHILSRERRDTRLAYQDAAFYSQEADRLKQELTEAKAEAWDEGSQARWDYQWRDDIEPLTNPYRSAK